ncbi:MAG: hypothetical protein QY305_06800 [Candidatus Brocadiaceae baterium WH-1]|nr:MAG: hypothetical protein QY305_06780 [Candidatus Jettenia sp. AMX2]WKZ23337.1 MAG: hypothetical protein QY305_06800 [Candidatus Jettenia sp. AMX2]
MFDRAMQAQYKLALSPVAETTADLHKHKKKTRILKVIRVFSIGIKRQRKIKAEANPYLPEYSNYFRRRKNVKEARLLGALSHRQYQAMIASR